MRKSNIDDGAFLIFNTDVGQGPKHASEMP